MPKVLIGDKLAPAAVEIFKQRGIETETKIGLSQEELAKEVMGFDGLVVRSACKPNAAVIEGSDQLKVIGRAGIGVDNIDIKAATKNADAKDFCHCSLFFFLANLVSNLLLPTR